jgi:hypothetical protein
MERKRAWITSVTIGVSFIAATGAIAANTGFLRIGTANREVGHLTPADLGGSTKTPSTLPTTTALTQLPKPIVVVKYEDVYVTTPAESEPVPDAVTPVALSLKRAIKASPSSRPTSNNNDKPEEHEGEYDDD